MADSNMQLQWTDEQWNKVRQVVYEEARKTRVAGNVLPLCGPLEPDARYASKQVLSGPPFEVEDRDSLRLITLPELVYLRGAQVADPELSSALIAFRRAANRIARREDELILRGRVQDDKRSATSRRSPSGPTAGEQEGLVSAVVSDDLKVSVGTGESASGAAAKEAATAAKEAAAAAKKAVAAAKKAVAAATDAAAKIAADNEAADKEAAARKAAANEAAANEAAANEADIRNRAMGRNLVRAVSRAIGELEKGYHLGPFACLLGHRYFLAVQTPSDSMVSPQDRILPFLQGGALLRTSVLDEEQGLVIALGGEPIDLVVATDISVSFLQVSTEEEDPRFVFRVYEKIVLRIKDPRAIALLKP